MTDSDWESKEQIKSITITLAYRGEKMLVSCKDVTHDRCNMLKVAEALRRAAALIEVRDAE